MVIQLSYFFIFTFVFKHLHSMRHLVIKNIGSIIEVDIELSKLNLFIGPQSSGKSTITKIACYCSWVEKRTAILNSNQESLSEKGVFAKELIRFHKLSGYLNNNSSIFYESDILTISYSHNEGVPVFKWKNRFNYKRGKISYIPSERNIVAAIPNWINIKFTDNNIRSFMSDWDEARSSCQKENPFNILNIGAKYFFDGERDKVIVDQTNRMLELTDTSSGMQSLIPLLVHLNYIYYAIYHTESPESVEDLYIKRTINSDLMLDVFGTNEPRQIFKLLEQRQKGGDDVDGLLSKFEKFETLVKHFSQTHFTNTYLEEPEQNLFPETQRDLVGELVRLHNLNEDHSLTITTHSPYVLSSINNLIYAHKVGEKDRGKVNAIIPEQSWIDFSKVRVYFVDKGTVSCLLDHEIKQIKVEAIDEVSNILNREYDDLLAIEN